MKIDNGGIYYAELYVQQILQKWQDEAIKIGLNTGIFVFVKKKTAIYGGNVERIYFQIGKLEADTLPELKRIIKMKAFI